MKIVLAGYNIEVENLDECGSLKKKILTPEIFSAAYARISRSSSDITSLRKIARDDVEKARASNKTIIFEMGHHSVAEHAVFNFDIMGVSRLALEEIEKFRLVSFTEKSQRYVTLEGDYFLPEEISKQTDRDISREIIQVQNEFYLECLSLLQEYNFSKFPRQSKDKNGRKTLENLAKEDARYILSLASEGQVGLTINARNLEHLFRRFSMSKLQEVRQIGAKMYDLVYRVAPSIFLFAQPSQFERDLQDSFKNNFSGALLNRSHTQPLQKDIETKITAYTEKADEIILASFLSIYNSMALPEAYERISGMAAAEKEKIFKDLFKNMAFFDAPPRAFELVDITYQAMISASGFAQLKRHRMATLLAGEYDIDLGNTIPESIESIGLEQAFIKIIKKTNKFYLELKKRYQEAADYILTNSHRRMVIQKMNLRELYHFIRLRDDEHAQWEIRKLAGEILHQVKELMPFSTMLLCGKDSFTRLFEKSGRRPL